jgi:tricorn protease-like protein
MRLARPPAVARLVALALFLGLLAVASRPSSQGKRPLAVDNLYDVRDVRDPQRSPDGKWVAYTVTRAIRETDKNDTDVWMVSWDGRDQVQLTSTPDNELRPRWSPDGKFLSFLSSRQGAKAAQVWLLNRGGGEAARLTDINRLRVVAGQPFARARRGAAGSQEC